MILLDHIYSLNTLWLCWSYARPKPWTPILRLLGAEAAARMCPSPGKAGVPANPGEVGPTAPCLCPSSQGAQCYPPTTASSASPSFSPVMKTVTPPLGVRCMKAMLPSSSCTGCPSSKERGSNESNACLLWSAGSGSRAPSAEAAWPPHVAGVSWDALTFLHCHLVNVRSGPILEGSILAPREACLLWEQKWREGARPRRGLRNTCLL